MKKFLSALIAGLFVLGAAHAGDCGSKAKDGKQMSAPDKVRT